MEDRRDKPVEVIRKQASMVGASTVARLVIWQGSVGATDSSHATSVEDSDTRQENVELVSAIDVDNLVTYKETASRRSHPNHTRIGSTAHINQTSGQDKGKQLQPISVYPNSVSGRETDERVQPSRLDPIQGKGSLGDAKKVKVWKAVGEEEGKNSKLQQSSSDN